MKKQFAERICKLIDLKSLITLALTIFLIYGFVVNKIEAKDFLMYVAMVFTFYFTKKDKGDDKSE
jgi:ACR3 family arsenite efflux pump ArsB